MENLNGIEYFKISEGNISVYGLNSSYMVLTLMEMKTAIDTVSRFDYRSKFQNLEFSIYIAPSREQFDYIVLNQLNINIKTPSSVKTIAIINKTDLVLLCPSAYELDSVYSFDLDDYRRLLVHETMHMLHQFLIKNNIENVSTWFAEGLAIYFSKQAKYESEMSEIVKEGVSRYKIPSIRELNEDIELAYDWGWTVVNYIDVTYGRDALMALLYHVRDKFVIEQLTTEPDVFELNWSLWLQDVFNE